MSAFARPLSPCSQILFSPLKTPTQAKTSVSASGGPQNVIGQDLDVLTPVSSPQPFSSYTIAANTNTAATSTDAQHHNTIQYAITASGTKIPSTAKISVSDFSDFFTDTQPSWPTQLAPCQPAQTVQTSQFPVPQPLDSPRIEDFVLYPQTAACPRPSAPVSLFNSSGHLQLFGTQSEPVNSSVADLSATSTQFLHPSLGIPANTAKMMNAADVPLDDTRLNGGAYASFPSPSLACGVNYTPGGLSIDSPNELTVSPQDLMLQDIISAPASTALTNLTSPNLSGSPDDGYCMSGNPGSVGIDSPNPWYTLFPDAQPGAQTSSESPSPKPSNDPGPLVRRLSNATSSRTGSVRQSEVSGVGARKRSREQAPIIVDENDPVAMKRARNTLAARKSRERKLERLQELEDEIARLKAERDHWKRLAIAHGAPE